MEWERGGTQCTVIALAALLFTSILDPNAWFPGTVDNAVLQWDSLYRYVVDTYQKGNHSQLLFAADLPPQVNIYGSNFTLECNTTVFGIIGHTGNDNFNMVSLQQALNLCLNSLGMPLNFSVTINGQTVALFSQGCNFYIFDSHARNQYGQTDPNGYAVLLCFTSIADVITYVEQNYRFVITPVQFAEMNRNNTEIENFSPHAKGHVADRMILIRATVHILISSH